MEMFNILLNMSEVVYYEYFPRFFPDKFPEVLAEVKDRCKKYEWERNNKIYLSNRASCVYSELDDTSLTTPIYGRFTTYDWNDTIINELRLALEEKLDSTFDYSLVHIYETGKDSINYHRDIEALNSTIASVSFGAARKFRLRKIGERKGYEKEFRLVSGDLFVMWGPGKCGNEKGCQRVYMHSVPIEKKVKLPRINLTFRQWEE